MANYASLKNIIDQYITTNGQGAITGAILNDVLKNIVNSIGADFLFGGIVEPSSTVGTPDQNVFYFALQAGTYTNFGNVVIPDGITIFKWNGSWSNQILFAGDGGVFDITAYNNNTKYADLTAALGTNGANVPQYLRMGGMSVKFVRSSDVKYVQFRYMSSSTDAADFTNVANWRGVGSEPQIVEIVGFGSTGVTAGVTQVGQYYVKNDESPIVLKYKARETAPAYDDVPWRKDAIYIFENVQYVWNGSSLYTTDKLPIIVLSVIADSYVGSSLNNGETGYNITLNTIVYKDLNGAIHQTQAVRNNLFLYNDCIYLYNGSTLSVSVDLRKINEKSNEVLTLDYGHRWKYEGESVAPSYAQNTNFATCKISVKAGDVIFYKGVGGVSPRLIIYKNLSNNDVYVAPASDTVDFYSALYCSVDGTVYFNGEKTYPNNEPSLVSIREQSKLLKIAINNICDSIAFEQGGINSSGSNTAESSSIRTIDYINGKQLISVPDGFKIGTVFYYTALGEFYASEQCNGPSTLIGKDGYVCRFTVKKQDDSVIKVRDFKPDTSLDNLVSPIIDVEIGNISSGVNSVNPARARTVGFLKAPFAFTIRSGYRLHYGYRYLLDGTFVDSFQFGWAADSTMFYKCEDDNYLYRFTFSTASGNDNITSPNDIILSFTNTIADEGADFNRGKRVIPVTGWYKTEQTDTAGFNANTHYNELIAAFNTLASNSNGYIVGEKIGESVLGKDIYAYTLQSPYVGYKEGTPKSKVLLIAGQQGFEKTNIYGIYYIFKDLLENWVSNPVLEYIRCNMCLKVIPVVNPDAIDTGYYYNADNVSLNRNYDTTKWVAGDPSNPNEYGGPTPASEPETQAVQNFIDNNLDASLFIDYHTNGSSIISSWQGVNWISVCAYPDNVKNALFYNRLVDASLSHLERVTTHFNKEFSLGLANSVALGYISANSEISSAKLYANEHNILSTTFEGHNGFIGGVAYGFVAQKSCAELIGNYIITVMNYLCRK